MFVVTCRCGASHPIELRSTSWAMRCSECGAMLDIRRELLDRAKVVMADGEMVDEECRRLCTESRRIREESAALRALRRR